MEISHEGENFVRVTKLVVDEIAGQLRLFFKGKWKSKFPTEQEWDDSPTSGNIFWKKMNNGAREGVKRDAKKIKDGSSQEWDCTLLCRIILDTGLKLVTPNEGVEIIRLRDVRNKHLQHLPSTEIPDNNMAEIFQEVRDVYRNLKWIDGAIDAYECDKLETEEIRMIRKKLEEEKEAALRKDQGDFDNLPKSITHFIGRDTEMLEAATALDSQNKFLLIHGGPCYGKSTLAIKIGHKMAEEGYNFVVWINMRDISTFDKCPDMDTLAEKILQGFQVDTSEMKDEIQSYLTRKLSWISSSKKKALLIFDNADCLISNSSQAASTDVYTQLTRLLESKDGIRAIFTSRASVGSHDDNDIHKMELSCLSSDDSEGYFKSTLDRNTLIDRESLVTRLAAWSHGLPLAMKILSSEVNEIEDKRCLQKYLDDVAKYPVKTINKTDKIMFHLFSASFNNMDDEELKMMKLLAVFPSGFSFLYLEKLAKEFELDSLLIRKLRKRGLVEWQNPSYLIHLYLCEFVRQKKWETGDQEMYEEAYACVYLKSLFEVSLASLGKDAYSEWQNEFISERHNFLHLMAFVREQTKKPVETEALSKLKGISRKPTLDYLAIRIFIEDIILPNVLIGFFEDCEKLVPEDVKPTIWCIRYDLIMKNDRQEIIKPSTYPEVKGFDLVLKDYRDIYTRVYQFRGRWQSREDGNKLVKELQELDEKTADIKNTGIKAYFRAKICKCLGVLYSTMREKTMAKEAREKALQFCDEAYGTSWLTFDCLEQLAKYYWGMKDHQNASEYFGKAESLAKQISLIEDQRYSIHLLNKGRFLLSTGLPDNIKDGTILLEESLQFHPPGSRHWCKALDFLAQNDPKRHDEILLNLYRLESPTIELLKLVKKPFFHGINAVKRETDQAIITRETNKAIEVLKSAIKYVTELLQRKDSNERKSKVFTKALYFWNVHLAIETDHCLTNTERRPYAIEALRLLETSDEKDPNDKNMTSLQFLQRWCSVDQTREHLQMKKAFLVKNSKAMKNAGMHGQLQEKYDEFFNESRNYPKIQNQLKNYISKSK
eukprot:Seg2923.3 transcript_id=Seg2923.3/GoldUCD/mRNA.D3Y31 product="Disease resistance protein RPS5" protein_id=Seg2923.3/GoldUCD/D3Y31